MATPEYQPLAGGDKEDGEPVTFEPPAHPRAFYGPQVPSSSTIPPIVEEGGAEAASSPLLSREGSAIGDASQVYKRQLHALLKKSWRYQVKQKKTNCCVICFPLVLVVIMVLLQVYINSLLDYTNADLRPFLFKPYFVLEDDYSHAHPGCPVEFAYAPPNQASQKIIDDVPEGPYDGYLLRIFDVITQFRDDLNKSDSRDSNFVVVPEIEKWVPYAGKDEIDKLMLDSWDDMSYHSGGYLFHNMDFTQPKPTFSYSFFFNETQSGGQDGHMFMHLVSQAVWKNTRGDADSQFTFSGVRNLPKDQEKIEFDISATAAAPGIYILVLHIILPIFLMGIVYEKQHKLREIMRMMGLKMHVYWQVNYLFSIITYLLVVFFLIISGVCAGFRFFQVGVPVYLLFFILWGNVVIAIAFFFSVFFRDSRTATVVGFLFVFASCTAAGVLVTRYFMNEGETPASTLTLISLYPTFTCYRGLFYIANSVADNGPGISLSRLNTEDRRMGDVLAILFVQAVILFALAYYLEQVWGSGYGVKKHPLWFLKRRQDGRDRRSRRVDVTEVPLIGGAVRGEEGPPADLEAEKDRVMMAGNGMIIRTIALRKVYVGTDGNAPKEAVKSLTLGIDANRCFGLLGPNGAGKTTVINMLCGLFKPTSGEAYINGRSIEDEMDDIHLITGVCPQHDILWEDLTARHHLEFFAELKCLKGAELKAAVDESLREVRLEDWGNKPVKSFSGGMKRRLSVALSLIGKPQVVFMDEPSTGLDPASRQNLWQVINANKRRCSIVLTTHSMEEADALCDRLAIFSLGELRCIGTSADLKRRFGAGFKLTFHTTSAFEEQADVFVHQLLPGAELVDSLAGVHHFEVPRGQVKLSVVFEEMEGNKEALSISDWGLSNTTLEEVFQKITSQEGEDEEVTQGE